MKQEFIKLEDITAYKIAPQLSDYVWEIVSKWNIFTKNTIGSQFFRAVDSIAANITEGFGRFHKKDKKIFIIMPGVHYMNPHIGVRRFIQEGFYQKRKMNILWKD